MDWLTVSTGLHSKCTGLWVLLVVELKAVECIAPIHLAQLLSYLKATRLQLGLLITFNVPLLPHGIRRVISGTS